jgi:hypothetical protein
MRLLYMATLVVLNGSGLPIQLNAEQVAGMSKIAECGFG